MLKSGYFYTGDNYMAACGIEEMVIYYPETGTYKNRVQLDYYLSDGLPKEYCQINFTSSDESRPIVFDENGEAVLYFRILPGVCDDCFGVKCTVERGGVEMEYSKFANLETLGRSLTFKEGGLTKFSVELKPAVVASPTKLNYFVPKPRTGFTAYWQADPKAIGYECQYVRTSHYDYDTDIETTYPKVKLTPVKGSGDMEGMYYVEVPGGMEADSYVLGVRPIPNSDSGLCDFDLSERTLYVGVPAFVRLHNSSCEKITESIITESIIHEGGNRDFGDDDEDDDATDIDDVDEGFITEADLDEPDEDDDGETDTDIDDVDEGFITEADLDEDDEDDDGETDTDIDDVDEGFITEADLGEDDEDDDIDDEDLEDDDEEDGLEEGFFDEF